MAMERVEGIIRSCFEVEDGILKIGEFKVSDIVKRYGTPVYVYDVSLVKRIYQDLVYGLSGTADIFYSMKANPSLALCGVYAGLGAGAEIGSIGELEIALKAGFPGERIVFAGPGKSEDELRAAIRTGILSINVESLMEIEDIAAICERERCQANISIRVNPSVEAIKLKVQMGGGAKGFGIDEEHLEEVLRLIGERQGLNLVGIHVYVGTQILDHNVILQNVEKTFHIAKRLNRWLEPAKLRIIDFGGGFGVPYYKKDQNLDSLAFTRGFREIIEEQRRVEHFARTHFILELGRFLVAKSGVYLAQIRYLKKSRGKRFAVLNGGMNHNAVATNNLGQPIKRKFPLCIVNKIGHPISHRVEIMGPLCTPLDSFGSDIDVPEIERGDIVGVFHSGAYGLTASPVNFLSHPSCGELFIEGRHCQWTRRRGEPSDLLRGQSLFPSSLKKEVMRHDDTRETRLEGDCRSDAGC